MQTKPSVSLKRSGVSSYSKQVQRLLAQREHVRRQIKDEQVALEIASSQVEHVLAAQAMLQQLAQGVQQQAHACISKIVSQCLETVFVEPYEFEIEFEQKRGKTEARLLFMRDEHEIDPLEGSGGGVIDVAAFALRLACLVLSNPASRRIMILDEPMKFLSKDYRPRFRELLKTISEDLQVQFIVVTHDPDLIGGSVVLID